MAGRESRLPALLRLALPGWQAGAHPGRRIRGSWCPRRRGCLGPKPGGEIRGTEIEISDGAGFVSFLRLLPKTATLWLCVLGTRVQRL